VADPAVVRLGVELGVVPGRKLHLNPAVGRFDVEAIALPSAARESDVQTAVHGAPLHVARHVHQRHTAVRRLEPRAARYAFEADPAVPRGQHQRQVTRRFDFNLDVPPFAVVRARTGDANPPLGGLEAYSLHHLARASLAVRVPDDAEADARGRTGRAADTNAAVAAGVDVERRHSVQRLLAHVTGRGVPAAPVRIAAPLVSRQAETVKGPVAA